MLSCISRTPRASPSAAACPRSELDPGRLTWDQWAAGTPNSLDAGLVAGTNANATAQGPGEDTEVLEPLLLEGEQLLHAEHDGTFYIVAANEHVVPGLFPDNSRGMIALPAEEDDELAEGDGSNVEDEDQIEGTDLARVCGTVKFTTVQTKKLLPCSANTWQAGPVCVHHSNRTFTLDQIREQLEVWQKKLSGKSKEELYEKVKGIIEKALKKAWEAAKEKMNLPDPKDLIPKVQIMGAIELDEKLERTIDKWIGEVDSVLDSFGVDLDLWNEVKEFYDNADELLARGTEFSAGPVFNHTLPAWLAAATPATTTPVTTTPVTTSTLPVELGATNAGFKLKELDLKGQAKDKVNSTISGDEDLNRIKQHYHDMLIATKAASEDLKDLVKRPACDFKDARAQGCGSAKGSCGTGTHSPVKPVHARLASGALGLESDQLTQYKTAVQNLLLALRGTLKPFDLVENSLDTVEEVPPLLSAVQQQLTTLKAILKICSKIPHIGPAFKATQTVCDKINSGVGSIETKLCNFDGKSEKAEAVLYKVRAIIEQTFAVLETVTSHVSCLWQDMLHLQLRFQGTELESTVGILVTKIEALCGKIQTKLESSADTCSEMVASVKGPANVLEKVSKLKKPVRKIFDHLQKPLEFMEKFVHWKIKIPVIKGLDWRPCPAGYKHRAVLCTKRVQKSKRVCAGRKKK